MGFYRELFYNDVVADFHDLYRAKGPPRVRWLGVEALKCPMDMWIYQELIYDFRPQVIIEGGTASGGSALFMATIMDAIGFGKIISMDWDHDPTRPQHPRITYIQGHTLDQNTVDRVYSLVSMAARKILILDDGHAWDHVLEELRLYAPLLSPGDYLIVEDTNLGGPSWGMDKYIEERPGCFERLLELERLMMTFNPKGYWKCVQSPSS